MTHSPSVSDDVSHFRDLPLKWATTNARFHKGIGKQLALNELRTVITKVLLNFDVRLAPGETGRALLEESIDMFTLINGKLELILTERKAEE